MSVPEFVNEDMTIGEAVMRYPVCADIMLSYGLACVGCHVSGIESIKQGAMGHGGMDEDDVADLINEMNEAIAEREGAKDSDDPLFITKRAIEKIHEFAKDEEKQDGLFLRVAIEKSDSAIHYTLDFEHSPRDDDILMDADGVPVRISAESLEHIEGSILDYIDGLQGSGFKFDKNTTKQ